MSDVGGYSISPVYRMKQLRVNEEIRPSLVGQSEQIYETC
jgi:hypothetical protein